MKAAQPVVYFNNCHNRDHVALYGSGAFFDLRTTGRQHTQARNLSPSQPCVVAERSPDNGILFDWYSFSDEALLRDEQDAPERVLFGRLFASETMPKEAAAISARYGALFRSNGHFKIGSVFHRAISPEFIPSGQPAVRLRARAKRQVWEAGAGFGNPAENRLVEAAAVQAVVKKYERHGWSVRSVERDKCGFDLECSRGGVIEQVEVKGVRGSRLCFIITAGEVKQARENAKFFLTVVTSALSASPNLTKVSGIEFGRRYDLSPVQYRAVVKR